jgi:hypothetical protein
MAASFIIPNGTSLSNALALHGNVPAGVLMPASWTAAGLSMEVSIDNTTFVPVTDDAGTEYTATVSASKFIVFANLPQFLAFASDDLYLRFRSGTSSVAVSQGAARTLTVVGISP